MGGLLGELSEKLAGEAAPEVGKMIAKTMYSGRGTVEELAPKWGKVLTGFLQRAQESFERMEGPELDKAGKVLSGLSKEDAAKFSQYAEAKATPAKPEVAAKVAQMHFHLDRLHDAVDAELKKAGGAGAAPKQVDYWPHEVPENIYASEGKRNAVIKDIMASNKGMTMEQAEKALMFGRKGGQKAGHFEIPRTAKNVPYKTTLDVYPNTVSQGVRRINDIRWFGKNDENMNKLFREIERETGSSKIGDYARSYAQHYLGRSVAGAPQGFDIGSRDWVQAWISAKAVQHLSLAIISHANKPLNILFMNGLGPLVKGMIEASANYGDAREWSLKAGSLSVRSLVEYQRVYGPEEPLIFRAGQAIFNPLTKIDRFFRIVGSVAGRESAKDWAAELLENPGNKHAMFKLSQLGVNASEVVANKGLTQDMLLTASKRASDITQFRNDVSQIPLWWRQTAYGRLASMYKSFYFQQAKFLKDVVVKPALEGKDFRPLAYLALVAPFAAEPFADLRTLARGTYGHRPGMDNYIDREVDNLIIGGVFGMYYELPMSMSSPSENFMWRMLLSNFFVPDPIISAAGTAITAHRIATSRHPKQQFESAAGKWAVGSTPYIGPYALHQEFPPKKPYKGPLERGVLTKGVKRLGARLLGGE